MYPAATVADFRPITVLNVGYKIIFTFFAKLMTARRGHHRCVEDTWYSAAVRDIMEAREKPLFIIYVDMAKAFDRVTHSLVTHLVSHLFEENAMVARLVNKAVNSIRCCIVNSRDLCRAVPYQLNSVVPQGDPISP
ncbi:hypothetical protein RF11_05629 [Thelohanellus kitauei]|uniref:Reverse transcriptase domain-containing protein n=1 Tax=Thelohanellus kitauei TaxID=669202 RepID=A0A0C2MV81_THEKT|nr:hypothetical protein RF11_05629 [Thelohanellus kitauei]